MELRFVGLPEQARIVEGLRSEARKHVTAIGQVGEDWTIAMVLVSDPMRRQGTSV
jgi:hypothetical protein